MKNKFNYTLWFALSGILMLTALSADAQYVNDYVKAGNDFYNAGKYYSAAQAYEKYLTGKTSKSRDGFDPYAVASASKGQKIKATNRKEIVYKAAESYRLLNNPVKAEPYYKEAASFGTEYPLARYWYAKQLRANSKFDDAEAEFNAFLTEYTTSDDYKADADKELKNLQFRSAQLKRTDLELYKVDKMGLNTEAANSAPAVVGTTLYFNSTRADNSTPGNNPHINKIYQTSIADNATVTKVDVALGKDEHLERPSFSADGQKMYVTKWTLAPGEKKSSAIYISVNQGNKWSDPVLLEGSVNASGFNSQQPFVSPDGQYLYYASDKPGGFGKMDLYVASLNADGKPGESTNLGAVINTPEDEEAPYYFAPEQTLVFSTNGRVGMGGYDFFQAKGSGSTWEEPINMGYPINSVKKDMYVASVGAKHLLDTMLFSSDRGSECCLELYTASKARPKRIIAGKIIDCLTAAPMQDVTITALDPANETPITTGTTDAFGRYSISVDEEQAVKVTAEAKNYTPKEIDVTKISTDTLVNVAVCLEPPQKPFETVENKPAVIPNIYFDYDKATLKPESFPVIDSVVGLMARYPTMAIEVGGHTDNIGGDEYNQKLSEARAKAFVDYVVSKGIDASRMQWKGYGESVPIAPNTIGKKDNPEGRAKNRRTEIKVIHY